MSNERPSNQVSAPSSAGQPIYMVYAQDQDVKIDLTALLGVIWKQKWLIVGITFLFVAAGTTYALLATPTFRAECVLAPNKTEQGPNLSASLGGLASLAGINLGVSPDRTDAVATLRSRILAEEFIIENQLMPVLFADNWDSLNKRWIGDDQDDWPDIRDGVQYFIEKLRFVDEDPSTGLVTLGIEWSDPQLAADWVEDLVQRTNDRLQKRDLSASERRLAYLHDELAKANLVELRQAISRLIENEVQTKTLARAETEYAFKVIDPPRVPNEQIAPKRLAIVFLAALLGGMVGVSLALVFGWSEITHDKGAANDRE